MIKQHMNDNDITIIKKNDKFLCVKNCYYTDSHEIIFKKGNVYISAQDEYITDEDGDIDHHFTVEFVKKYLIKLTNNNSTPKTIANCNNLELGDKIQLITNFLINKKKNTKII